MDGEPQVVRGTALGVGFSRGTGGVLRRVVTARAVRGRFEVGQEGVFFRPNWFGRAVGGAHSRWIAKWPDVAQVDLERLFPYGAVRVFLRGHEQVPFLGYTSARRFGDALNRAGFGGSERGHELSTRPPAEPDWSRLSVESEK